MTDDVRLRFGNAEPVVGHEAVAARAAALASVVASMSHKFVQIWTVDESDSVVICEMESIYHLHDGSELTLPVVDVFRLRDGLIADYRIYMDITPIFKP